LKKEKIIVNAKSASNTYKCDSKKSFIVIGDGLYLFFQVWRMFIGLALFAQFGLFIGILNSNTVAVIINASFFVFFIAIFIPLFYFEIRKKVAYKKLLHGATIWLGTIILVTKKRKNFLIMQFLLTIKPDNSNQYKEILVGAIVGVDGNSQNGKRIAVATCGGKNIIITKCTLIAD